MNQATRIADLIFRLRSDELVVLMPDADQGAGRVVIDRVAETLAAMPAGAAVREALRIGFACGPYDGSSVRDLLDGRPPACGRRRRSPVVRHGRPVRDGDEGRRVMSLVTASYVPTRPTTGTRGANEFGALPRLLQGYLVVLIALGA